MEGKELAEIKAHLVQMRDEVLAESERAYAASQSLGKDGVPDIGDMSSNSYHQEVLMHLSETQRSRVRDIDAALERIDKGVYGLCIRCEEEIPARRMEVRPFSRYCVDCKAEVEKFGE
ncbi:TraR/DksA family transcriptional regulator [uncultured Desulfuromusa sp.]|uniref:TraR/DksA family transcriptional regulator n=1 Tax=uncultured Desulfuromusa sp. TaxID=219183 RepID=UPI002AA72367|nr:TraR/DksA family transcriptional regulator [uncultured Desulfuromusa sp.]